MRVLVACEFSGVVRQAFRKRGHEAWSCDLIASEIPGRHFLGKVQTIIKHPVIFGRWDLMIAHPPCTHLAVSGARWFKDKQEEQAQGLNLVWDLLHAPIPKICIENPVSIISSVFRKPDQIIQPWQFGHEFTKTTCLWLKGLPKLEPTKIVGPGEFVYVGKDKTKLPKWYSNAHGGDRGRTRSRTFQGIADAMAEQWGGNS